MPKSQLGHYGDAQATPQHNVTIAAEVPIAPERRNVVPGNIDKEERWYVCMTHPQREIRAAESLRLATVQGERIFTAYVPCEFFWKRPTRANLKLPRREFQRPAMRSYIFVGIEGGVTNEALAVMRERDSEMRNRHGLLSILGVSDRGPIALSETGISWLSAMAQNEREGLTDITPKAEFDIGTEVRIKTGSLAGFTSRVMAFDIGKEEVLVEISLMGRASEMRLKFTDVEKPAYAA